MVDQSGWREKLKRQSRGQDSKVWHRVLLEDLPICMWQLFFFFFFWVLFFYFLPLCGWCFSVHCNCVHTLKISTFSLGWIWPDLMFLPQHSEPALYKTYPGFYSQGPGDAILFSQRSCNCCFLSGFFIAPFRSLSQILVCRGLSGTSLSTLLLAVWLDLFQHEYLSIPQQHP